MEEVKEFKVGDYILKDDVYTSEGSARYRRMSDFCNDNKLVMKEDYITMTPEVEQMEDEVNEWVYIIAEPEKEEPEPMSEEDAALQDIENAKAYLKATDMYAIKCAELGLDMRTEYPEIFERRRAYRQIVNDLERQFSIKSDAQRLAE